MKLLILILIAFPVFTTAQKLGDYSPRPPMPQRGSNDTCIALLLMSKKPGGIVRIKMGYVIGTNWDFSIRYLDRKKKPFNNKVIVWDYKPLRKK